MNEYIKSEIKDDVELRTAVYVFIFYFVTSVFYGIYYNTWVNYISCIVLILATLFSYVFIVKSYIKYNRIKTKKEFLLLLWYFIPPFILIVMGLLIWNLIKYDVGRFVKFYKNLK